MTLDELKTKKVAIVGMGINNRFLAKYLEARGVSFTVIDDWKNTAELEGRIFAF